MLLECHARQAPLSGHKIQQFKRHNALLQKLSNISMPINREKSLFKAGADSHNIAPITWSYSSGNMLTKI